MDIFPEYYSPYLFALAFVALIGALEIISLLFGNVISGIFDSHLGDYDAVASGHLSQFFHYLNIGRIPALVVICLIAGCFGLSGLFLQHLSSTLLHNPLPNLLLAPVCMLFAVVSTHYCGRLLRRWLPTDETSAITEDDFIGVMATITGHHATAQTPCEGKFKDKFGQLHYVLLEPEKGQTFSKGDKVLIICRLSASRYLAELNPWPNEL
ncbi:OB-fold-containig protein [Phytobacter sp. V91]|uniref:OB-fold-containig protein n=1 Tax=Phytobacter sp. V91 TaxID=3369425 RepID=UPI003F640E0C